MQRRLLLLAPAALLLAGCASMGPATRAGDFVTVEEAMVERATSAPAMAWCTRWTAC